MIICWDGMSGETIGKPLVGLLKKERPSMSVLQEKAKAENIDEINEKLLEFFK